MKFYLLAPFVVLLVAGSASAGVVADYYPIDGTNDAFTINEGYAVSDAFTLGSAATVNGVNFGVWLFSGDSVQTVDWSISSGDIVNGLGTVYGSGTGAAVSLAPGFTPFVNGDGLTIESETFAFADLPLSSGTYFLTLQNAVVNTGDPVYWDMGDVQTASWEFGDGGWGDSAANCNAGQVLNNNGGGYTGNCANSFQILGSDSSAPEPASFVLLGSGLLLAAFLRVKAARG